MINKIDLIHKKFFISLSAVCILSSYFFSGSISINGIQTYLLFFFVSIIGIPHGFFDFSIGRKIFKKFTNKWFIYFSLSYILILLIYLVAWVYAPGISLLFFLLLAAYHFGYEDNNYLFEKKHIYINLNIFIKGIIIVFTPIIFHFEQVSELFSLLINSPVKNIEFTMTQKMLFITLSVFHILLERNRNYLFKIEALICFCNFIILPPLISFTIYFCFLHSIRHFIESIYISNLVPNNFTIKKFLVTIILFSLVISFLLTILLSNYLKITVYDAIIKYVFISLACLTLPHMIFNMIPYKK